MLRLPAQSLPGGDFLPCRTMLRLPAQSLPGTGFAAGADSPSRPHRVKILFTGFDVPGRLTLAG